jgi:hypothetical protein
MKVIEQLVEHLRREGVLGDSDYSWLRDQGFLPSLMELYDYDEEYENENDREEIGEQEEHLLIEGLLQDRAKRQRIREIPKSSKGARKARKIRKLIGSHGEQKRDSVRIKAEQGVIERIESSSLSSAIPALRKAIYDVRPAVVVAALEVLSRIGLPYDRELIEHVRLLKSQPNTNIAIAAAIAELHLHPLDSVESVRIVRDGLIQWEDYKPQMRSEYFRALLELGPWVTKATSPLLTELEGVTSIARLIGALLQSATIMRHVPEFFWNEDLASEHNHAELFLIKWLWEKDLKKDSTHADLLSQSLNATWTNTLHMGNIFPKWNGKFFSACQITLRDNDDPNEILFRSALHLIVNTWGDISKDDFRYLSTSGWIWLNGVKEICVEVAKSIRWHRSDGLLLNGLKGILDDVAKELSLYQGQLHLNGLRVLSDKAAHYLSHHRGRYLSLSSLCELSDKAALRLCEYQGRLVLDSSKLPPSAAAILQSKTQRTANSSQFFPSQK